MLKLSQKSSRLVAGSGRAFSGCSGAAAERSGTLSLAPFRDAVVAVCLVIFTSLIISVPAAARGISESAAPLAKRGLIELAQLRPGRRRGGGGGIGIGVGIGAIIIQEAVRAEERKRGRRTRPERQTGIVCRKGTVRGGRCRCGSGRTSVRIGRNVYACERRKRHDAVRTNPQPKRASIICRNGVVRRHRCYCAAGLTQVRLRRNTFLCKPRIAEPRPGTISDPGPSTVNDEGTRTGLTSTGPVPPPPTRPINYPTVLPPVPPGGSIPEFVPDEVVISVPSAAPQTLEADIAGTHGLTILDRQESNLLGERLVRMRVQPSANVPNVVNQLQGDPRVLAAQPNYVYHKPVESQSQPVDNLQYALTKVGLTTAASETGQGVVIAVIDTGIDAAHPDLKNVVAKDFNAIGDNGTKPDNHGTAIAGIISGRGLVRGVAPGARLLDIRAFKAGSAGAPRLATSFVVQRGMDWAIGEKARILNLSFAGPRDPLLFKAIRAARAKDAIMVASAGNDGAKAPPAYPAAYEEVIAVTATDVADKLYDRANRGPYIALAAPGVDILAPSAGKSHNLNTGTSFAAAHVSGILALLLQRAPGLTSVQALEILTGGARDLGEPGRDDQYGAGQANAGAALRKLPKSAAGK